MIRIFWILKDYRVTHEFDKLVEWNLSQPIVWFDVVYFNQRTKTRCKNWGNLNNTDPIKTRVCIEKGCCVIYL